MNYRKILNSAIEKALANKWNWDNKDSEPNASIIFSHSFAKAFWGIETPPHPQQNHKYQWQHHLQQMVLEENPLKYLEKFL